MNVLFKEIVAVVCQVDSSRITPRLHKLVPMTTLC